MLTPASSQFSACGHAQILEVAIHVYGNGGKDTRQEINGSLMIISNLTSHSTRNSCWLVVCEEHCEVSIELSGCGEAGLELKAVKCCSLVKY